jgi:hypothetical protein
VLFWNLERDHQPVMMLAGIGLEENDGGEEEN